MGKADKAEGGGRKAEQTPPLKVESQGRGTPAAAFSVRTARVTARQSYCRRVLPEPRGAWPRSLPYEYQLANDFFGKAEVT